MNPLPFTNLPHTLQNKKKASGMEMEEDKAGHITLVKRMQNKLENKLQEKGFVKKLFKN